MNKDRETNKKLAEGKFTFTGMFKSHDAKMKAQAGLLETIAQTERDIENWDVVKRFLIVYLAEIAIPEFKSGKVIKYITAMQGFSKEELQNAQKNQNCWGDFYDLTKAYKI